MQYYATIIHLELMKPTQRALQDGGRSLNQMLMQLRCNERFSMTAFAMQHLWTGVEGTIVSHAGLWNFATQQANKEINAISTVKKHCKNGLQVVRLYSLCNLSHTVIEVFSPEATRMVWTGTKPQRNVIWQNKSVPPLNLSWHEWLMEIAEKQGRPAVSGQTLTVPSGPRVEVDTVSVAPCHFQFICWYVLWISCCLHVLFIWVTNEKDIVTIPLNPLIIQLSHYFKTACFLEPERPNC